MDTSGKLISYDGVRRQLVATMASHQELQARYGVSGPASNRAAVGNAGGSRGEWGGRTMAKPHEQQARTGPPPILSCAACSVKLIRSAATFCAAPASRPF